MAERLPEADGERLRRERRLTFRLDRRQLEGFSGDTVGSALVAAGVTVSGRSFKYHRPRGLRCMTGACPTCLVTVDGVPNVRACLEPLREGIEVERQNALLSADHDLLRVLDRLDFALPAGFYYKVLMRPRLAWRLAEPWVRRMAGLGKPPRSTQPEHRHEAVTAHTDVLVVGGGAAGLAAAAEAARAGCGTMVLESEPEGGGWLLSAGQANLEVARRLVREALETGVDVQTSTVAFGVFDGPVVAAHGPRGLVRIRPRQLVFATGAIEQVPVFPNNDLPGVMTGQGVERLLNLYRVAPGRDAVVLACGPEGRQVAAALIAAGARVTLLDSTHSDAEPPEGCRVLPGRAVLRAVGRRRVEAVEIDRSDSDRSRRLPCDLLVVAGILAPATALVSQAGAGVAFDRQQECLIPVEMPEGVLVAGGVTGTRSLAACVTEGRRAGAAAATALGRGAGQAAPIQAVAREAERAGVTLPRVRVDGRDKQFACICMDVTDKELTQAIAEGFDSLELIKRYTAVAMGPCQGRSCTWASTRLCAHLLGRSLAQTGTTTARPPWAPVPLGVLAADHVVPRKETPIHDCHVDAGAEFMWAGEWRRPHHYEDPERECEAVHKGVAVIDVSSLGKFRVKGPQAVELLERLYPNRFGDLKVGRVRYGAMLNEGGTILDDGTIARLAGDEFFVTTTTGGTAAMDQWISWWLADWGLDVHVLNVSGAYAAVNVAGPLSRTVIERLTDLDVSAAAMPYLTTARGRVAGVESLILRIGFVGELGYEVHFPSGYGEHVWHQVLEAGRGHGIVPFGLEAQRILRLEKQHILVGQDTDALSDPISTGLGWMVKLDKPDFLGRRALAAARESGPEERMVGFTMAGREVPSEGAAVVHEGRPVGRICSSRWSGAVGSVIGLAWIQADWAEDGHSLEVAWNGRRAAAAVHMKPFYDPAGSRLRM